MTDIYPQSPEDSQRQLQENHPLMAEVRRLEKANRKLSRDNARMKKALHNFSLKASELMAIASEDLKRQYDAEPMIIMGYPERTCSSEEEPRGGALKPFFEGKRIENIDDLVEAVDARFKRMQATVIHPYGHKLRIESRRDQGPTFDVTRLNTMGWAETEKGEDDPDEKTTD